MYQKPKKRKLKKIVLGVLDRVPIAHRYLALKYRREADALTMRLEVIKSHRIMYQDQSDECKAELDKAIKHMENFTYLIK